VGAALATIIAPEGAPTLSYLIAAVILFNPQNSHLAGEK